MVYVFHGVIIALLTVFTQIGGIAWLIALFFRKKPLVFGLFYGVLSATSLFVAPLFGRVPLSCGSDGPLQVQSWVYCLTNRSYVTPKLKGVLADLSEDVNQKYPGTKTLVLDASFPFWDGFPLVPHLSHDDGKKADLAFYYSREGIYQPGAARSPIGYFAFEEGPTHCPSEALSLRWDLPYLQPLWRNLELEPQRTAHAMRWLNADRRIEKVFLELHLQKRLKTTGSKIGFQGCRAARHDDHIHFQVY